MFKRLVVAGLKAQVLNGATFLDKAYPRWAQKVDPDRLDIGSGEACVLGQLRGGYKRGLATLGLREAEAGRLGFNIRPTALSLFWPTQAQYEALNEFWREAIAARRIEATTQAA